MVGHSPLRPRLQDRSYAPRRSEAAEGIDCAGAPPSLDLHSPVAWVTATTAARSNTIIRRRCRQRPITYHELW